MCPGCSPKGLREIAEPTTQGMTAERTQRSVALMVNGDLVTDDMIAEQLSLLLHGVANPAAMARDPRVQHAAEENAVLRILLQQQAERSAAPIRADELAAELASRRGTGQSSVCSTGERLSMERDLRVRKYIAESTRRVARPPQREVLATYQRQRSRFTLPASAHVRHIVVNVDELTSRIAAEERMGEAQAALAAGEPFATVADRFSDCAGNGGELGWIARGEMVEEFDQVVFALKPSETSGIFPTRFGLHIAQVVDVRPNRVQTFDEVREAIAREMHDLAKEQALAAHLRGLAAAAEIHRVQLRRRDMA